MTGRSPSCWAARVRVTGGLVVPLFHNLQAALPPPAWAPQSCSSPTRGSHAPLQPGLQPLGPPSIPSRSITIPSPLGLLLPDPELFLRGKHIGPLGPVPALPPLHGAHHCPSPTMCPGPLLSCSILWLPQLGAGGRSVCSTGKEESSRRWDMGFYSLYPSTFEKIIVQVST